MVKAGYGPHNPSSSMIVAGYGPRRGTMPNATIARLIVSQPRFSIPRRSRFGKPMANHPTAYRIANAPSTIRKTASSMLMRLAGDRRPTTRSNDAAGLIYVRT